jgi:hypothetical protein
MDLPKFLLMLEQESLYFAVFSEFEDKWEAVIPRELTMGIANQFRAASGAVIQHYDRLIENLAVDCWYSGNDESVAMWRLYTNSEYGVEIRSSVGHLRRSLSVSPENVYLGKVEYRDYNEVPSQGLSAHQLTPFKAALQKRPCYEHEHEIRAIIEVIPDFLDDVNSRNISVRAKRGKNIRTHLRTLIHSLTTGPNFPAWAWELLRSALSRVHLDFPINESNVFKAPPARFIEE